MSEFEAGDTGEEDTPSVWESVSERVLLLNGRLAESVVDCRRALLGGDESANKTIADKLQVITERASTLSSECLQHPGPNFFKPLLDDFQQRLTAAGTGEDTTTIIARSKVFGLSEFSEEGFF